MATITAHTLDGTQLFTSPTHQKNGDAVYAYFKANARPRLYYTCDDTPGIAWPYTQWKYQPGETVVLIGTPFATLAQITAL